MTDTPEVPDPAPTTTTITVPGYNPPGSWTFEVMDWRRAEDGTTWSHVFWRLAARSTVAPDALRAVVLAKGGDVVGSVPFGYTASEAGADVFDSPAYDAENRDAEWREIGLTPQGSGTGIDIRGFEWVPRPVTPATRAALRTRAREWIAGLEREARQIAGTPAAPDRGGLGE